MRHRAERFFCQESAACWSQRGALARAVLSQRGGRYRGDAACDANASAMASLGRRSARATARSSACGSSPGISMAVALPPPPLAPCPSSPGLVIGTTLSSAASWSWWAAPKPRRPCSCACQASCASSCPAVAWAAISAAPGTATWAWAGPLARSDTTRPACAGTQTTSSQINTRTPQQTIKNRLAAVAGQLALGDHRTARPPPTSNLRWRSDARCKSQ